MEPLEEKLLDIQRKKLLVQQDRIRQLKYKSIGFTGWYLKDTDKVYYDEEDNLFTIDLPRNKSTLITYQELNHDLTTPPYMTNITQEKNTKVKFNGETDENVNCELLITEYKFNETKTHTIDLNNSQIINIQKESRIRFSIKVSGFGKFSLKELSFGEINLWESNNLSVNNEYKWIPSKNWLMPTNRQISYDQEIDTFFVNHSSDLCLHYGETVNQLYSVEGIIDESDLNSLYVNFTGNKDVSVYVHLNFIIYLSDGSEITHSISLNEYTSIKIPMDSVNFSLSIYVKGNGIFNIENIILSGYNYWPQIHSSTKNTLNFLENAESVFHFNTNSMKAWKQYSPKLTFNKWKQEFMCNLKDSQTINIEYLNINEFKPKPNRIYNIQPQAKSTENVNINFVIIVANSKEEKQVFHIPFNQQSNIKIPLDVINVEFYLKVEGQGNFKECVVFFQEKKAEITNEVKVSLNADDWFVNYKEIDLTNDGNKLFGRINLPDGKRYISYREMNNSFSNTPENNIIRIKRGHNYLFEIKGVYDNTAQIIPMVIGYSDKQKIELHQLKINSKNVIKFHNSVSKIRLVMRLSGKGSFEIDKFNLQETPVAEEIITPHFNNRFEIDDLKLLPPKKLKEIKMAVIFDEFTEASFDPECKLIKFTPNNWRETLLREQPDLLMVESAWRGNNGTWEKMIGSYGEENNRELFNLIDWCNGNDIPTVFWNKEDPVHFERFINVAKKFDVVFTTDENVIPRYRERLGHDKVYALPFAAQPLIHNPIKLYENRVNKVCFAGSYYHHHVERSIDMNALLDAAANYGLDIYDRNYNKTKKGLMPNHQFPSRFQSYIKGNLKYYEIDKAYKGYKVNMNVNTVKNSNTMFSRRVFESLACGTPIVSNSSYGIRNIFNNLVFSSDEVNELESAFNKLLNDDNYYNKISHLGMREVLTKHTYKNRLLTVLENSGRRAIKEDPLITVVGVVNTADDFKEVLYNFEKQNYTNKKLCILTEVFDGYLSYFKKYNNGKVNVFVKDYVLNNYPNIKEWINSDYIAYFSKNDFYGKNYLSDLILPIYYSNADFIGKNNYYRFNVNHEVVEMNANKNYEFTTYINPSRSIINVNALAKNSIKEIISKFEGNIRFDEYFSLGYLLFSSDCFNYIENIKATDHNLVRDKLESIEI